MPRRIFPACRMLVSSFLECHIFHVNSSRTSLVSTLRSGSTVFLACVGPPNTTTADSCTCGFSSNLIRMPLTRFSQFGQWLITHDRGQGHRGREARCGIPPRPAHARAPLLAVRSTAWVEQARTYPPVRISGTTSDDGRSAFLH